jgi:hypothetical protein
VFVQILLAATLFTALMAGADRLASRWTVEDPITLRARRHSRSAQRREARRERLRRFHAARPRPAHEPELQLARRPIQVVAADLRRLNRQLALVPTGSTLVRWKALWAAYDGVLMEAAEMLELTHELAAAPAAGTARDVERVRVLAALEAAGLVVRD